MAQNNLFGTGNALSLQINTGEVNTVYALSFTNPYINDDGLGLGVDLYKRNVDSTSLDVGPYETSTIGAGLRFLVPINETDTINYGIAAEQTDISYVLEQPRSSYINFVNDVRQRRTRLCRSRQAGRATSRDSAIFTTSGTLQRANLEVAVPPAELRYYRTQYAIQWYLPLARGERAAAAPARIGYADGYSDLPLPFYKNFYLGGIGSVRGYETASIGPKDAQGDALGGNVLLIASAEYYFPFPGLQKDKLGAPVGLHRCRCPGRHCL